MAEEGKEEGADGRRREERKELISEEGMGGRS
jgi:hypothetical protein